MDLIWSVCVVIMSRLKSNLKVLDSENLKYRGCIEFEVLGYIIESSITF